jgi:hypothetical protein
VHFFAGGTKEQYDLDNGRPEQVTLDQVEHRGVG